MTRRNDPETHLVNETGRCLCRKARFLAIGNILALQPLDLALQAVVPALQAAILTVHAFVARQIVTESLDLPVLLLDDNVPRVLFRWSLVQNRAYAAQQAHAPFLSARRTRTFTPSRRFFAGTR